jgi:predicted transport protein
VQCDETARLILRAAAQKKSARDSARSGNRPPAAPSAQSHLARAHGELRALADDLFAYAAAVGPEVSVNPLKSCIAFRTTRNFCCLDVYSKHVFVVLDLDPALAKGCEFARDVSNVGHQGTGDLQLHIERPEQVERAKELTLLAYQTSLRA